LYRTTPGTPPGRMGRYLWGTGAKAARPQDRAQNHIIHAMSSLDPRLSAAILAAGSASLASRTLKTGGGSTVPGVVARRVDPRVLTKLSRRLPMGSAAITGTNGKTTTTRMVSRILRSAGIGAVNNSTGANLVTGVTAALVADTGLSGAPSSEMGLFEVDEASVPRVAAEAEIKILAVLNLFRDQLDRYGELAYTGKVIASAFGDLPQDGAVVLNADDPLVASLGRSARRPVFFGVDEPTLDTGRLQHVADSKDCPVCGTALDYETVYMGHVGVYDCPHCDFSRPEPDYRASRVRLEGARGSEFLLSTPKGEAEVKVTLPGLYNVYNALAAASLAIALGTSVDDVRNGLERFSAAFGRFERIAVGERRLLLLLVKNPAGANEAIRTLVTGSAPKLAVLALNDAIADGRDVSWIWDVDWEPLLAGLERVVVTGERAAEMALRCKYGGFAEGAIEVVPSLERALDRGLELTPPGSDLVLLPTYTAMLALQRVVSDRGLARPYWERAA
jgi:lipid II isoglutaminyl synthase (glutamine-hydrolysing)